MQQLTNTHVKRWKEHRHEIGYGHLVPRTLQVFSGAVGRLFLRRRPLRGAQSAARKSGDGGRSSGGGRVWGTTGAKIGISRSWPIGRSPRPANWLELVNQPQTEAELAALRSCVNRGRPFGDSDWVARHGKDVGPRVDHAAARPTKTSA